MKCLKVKITHTTDPNSWYRNHIGEEILVALPGRYTLNFGYDLLGTEKMNSDWRIEFYDCIPISYEYI